MSITLVGLGTKPEHLTKQGENAIQKAKNVVVTTSKSPTYAYFENIKHTTLDSFFDNSDDFDQMSEKTCEYLLSLKGKTVLCSIGDGVSGSIVQKLFEKTNDIEIVPGVASVTALKSKSGFCDSYTHYTATDFLANVPVEINRNYPTFITEIDDKYLASDLKLILLDKIGECEIIFLKRTQKLINVVELDRQNYDHTACLIIPPKPLTERERYGFSDLIEIMKILRAPTGCPWDREQTHQSIRKNLIEEAYELDEAIEKEDTDMMTEECGDVLLQSAFNALIGEEEGEFTLSDVLSMLCVKLVNRHTHIFGDIKAENALEALTAWENAKKKEKEGKGKFDSVPRAMPALLRAQKILKCAGVKKEITQRVKTQREWGELLFDLVREMRAQDVDGEEALQGAISEFIKGEQNLDS
ncbi:MAG: MazG family protein [Clostridia bacterium]|nr:MazG family protein [Clostridia bacterium]